MNPSSAVEPELNSSEEKSAETSFQVSLPPRISNLFYPSALIFSGAGRFTESIPQIQDITGTGDLKPRCLKVRFHIGKSTQKCLKGKSAAPDADPKLRLVLYDFLTGSPATSWLSDSGDRYYSLLLL
ncbi:MAG: hypothetical protein K6F35_02285 [Lachnospiraceae bacterium]|nr:hypothetical protein [Lachnospiraceae bacterium]